MHATQERLTTVLPPTPAPLGGASVGVSLSELELRTRRDLLGRRITREWVGRVVRVLGVMAVDISAGAIGVWLALALTPGAGTARWLHLSAVVGVRLLLALAAFQTYTGGRIGRRNERVALAVGVVAVATYLLGLLDRSDAVSLWWLTVFFLSTTSLIWVGRFVGSQVARRVLPASLFRRRTLLLGEREHAWELLDRIHGSRRGELEVVGHLVPDAAQDPRALGGFELLGEVIEKYDVRSVIISARLPAEQLSGLIREAFLHGTSVSVIPPVDIDVPGQVTERDIAGWPALRVELPRGYLFQLACKRAIDVVGALVGLILLSPLFLVIAVAIKLSSPGPVFFRQWRPGLGGRQFRMFKFRTMRTDAEEVLKSDPVLYKKFLENDCKLPPNEDPRIFPVGGILRGTSLDELPQLINVLIGDMSLVGPRPVIGPELENYGAASAILLAARPGMTGYWQVNGRSSVAYPERAEMDLHYINRWSLLLDLKILLRTIPAVVSQRGAY